MTLRPRILLMLAALGLAGCGGLGSGEVTERVRVPLVLTEDQVDRHPEGSPERVVFEWWRALQFDNSVAASRYYDSSLRMTPTRLARQLQYGTRPLGLNRRPRLVDVEEEEEGDRATVLLLLDDSKRNPNGRVDTDRIPRGFNLVRERGDWKLAENMYLESRARFIRSLAKAAARRQDDGNQ